MGRAGRDSATDQLQSGVEFSLGTDQFHGVNVWTVDSEWPPTVSQAREKCNGIGSGLFLIRIKD
jgi:hypothetical protein